MSTELSLIDLSRFTDLNVFLRHVDHVSASLFDVVHVPTPRCMPFPSDDPDVILRPLVESELSRHRTLLIFLLEVAVEHRAAILNVRKQVHYHQSGHKDDCRPDDQRSYPPPGKHPLVPEVIFFSIEHSQLAKAMKLTC